MSQNPGPPAAPSGLRGWCCCLLPAVLTLGWFLGARFLPERVAWYPFWLAAVLWNGSNGHGGLGRLFG